MDEPFAALDAITREELQDDLLRLVALRRTTVLFVTHDIAEAVYLGDQRRCDGSRQNRSYPRLSIWRSRALVTAAMTRTSTSCAEIRAAMDSNRGVIDARFIASLLVLLAFGWLGSVRADIGCVGT